MNMKFEASITVLFWCGAILMTATAAATPVYKWEDQNGVTHYASSPKARSAKPAELAPIMRGELKLAVQKVTTCDAHGGVDCRAGSDGDGSVICSDGFKGATPRFRFSCSSPKLELADISPVGNDGGFSVFIRNSKSVAAKKPAVSVKLADGSSVTLVGPENIEPYGLAEFQLKADGKLQMASAPTAADISVACANCP